jgi:hypothetical protein
MSELLSAGCFEGSQTIQRRLSPVLGHFALSGECRGDSFLGTMLGAGFSWDQAAGNGRAGLGGTLRQFAP